MNPLHAGDAYVSRDTTTARKTACRPISVMPWNSESGYQLGYINSEYSIIACTHCTYSLLCLCGMFPVNVARYGVFFIIIIIIYRFLERHKSLDYRGAKHLR